MEFPVFVETHIDYRFGGVSYYECKDLQQLLDTLTTTLQDSETLKIIVTSNKE